MIDNNKYLLAAELRELIERLPGGEFARIAAGNMNQVRQLRTATELAIDQRVRVEDIKIECERGLIPVRCYRPRTVSSAGAALVYFHGGAFCMGSLDSQHQCALQVAAELGIFVMSVDYRLAPECPFPAGLDDCLAAFSWVVRNAGALSIDPSRIAVGGRSSGGCLAAAVALMARDRAMPAPAFQFLVYPLLDDRPQSVSMHTFLDTPVLNSADATHAWELYLQGNSRPVSAYAAPARASDLRGLPPAYIMTAQFDPARDEAIEYAARMLRAGVSVELHNVAGAVHGFDMLGRGPLAQLAAASQLGALRRGLSL